MASTLVAYESPTIGLESMDNVEAVPAVIAAVAAALGSRSPS